MDRGERQRPPGFVVGVARTERFEGPLASPRTLAEYDAVVPGSAARMVACHERNAIVTADAIERLSRAEVTVAKVGTVAAHLATLTAPVGAIALVLHGREAGAVLAVVPAVLSASAQVVTAVRRR